MKLFGNHTPPLEDTPVFLEGIDPNSFPGVSLTLGEASPQLAEDEQYPADGMSEEIAFAAMLDGKTDPVIGWERL
jgi:hypothetical protein